MSITPCFGRKVRRRSSESHDPSAAIKTLERTAGRPCRLPIQESLGGQPSLTSTLGALALSTLASRLGCRRKSVDGALTLYYKASMKAIKRTIAIIELLLVFPAALFMIALFLREVQPLAQTGRLVEWFSHHVVLGLYVFLIAMPLAAFVVGCGIVLRSWRSDAEFRRATLEIITTVRAHVASLLIAGATLMAGGILAIVAMHMITE